MISKSGIINVLKPTGLTSSDVVVRVRKILSLYFGEKVKVGHLGTLDPPACGVLPIAYGSATRLFDYFIKKVKMYRAEFVFGKTTDTLDSFGILTAESDVVPTVEEIKGILPNFIGEIEQIPPLYSAISIGGHRAYDLARKGKSFDIPSRIVKVFDIKILSFKGNKLCLDIVCEGGTYIRTLGQNIAEALNSVAYMSWLIRLKSGQFELKNTVTFDELQANIENCVLDLATVVEKNFDCYIVPNELEKDVLNGVKIPSQLDFKVPFAVKIREQLIGIGEIVDAKLVVKTRLW